MTDFRRLSITNMPANGWKIIHPVYKDGKVIATSAEDAIGFMVEIEESQPHQFLVTSIPFGVSGIPDTDFATQSPSDRIEIPGDGEFRSREELLAYWNMPKTTGPCQAG
jgi:hypothetical protein